MNLPEQIRKIILSMRCCLCKSILSVAPLMSLSGDGSQIKCGRCKNVEIPCTFRNFTLEELMKTYLLPCIYPDCNEILIWGDVESHENTCDKKTITCPILDCRATVRQRNFGEHLKSYHEMHCYVGSVEDVLTQSGLIMSFIMYNRQYFIVMIRQVVNSPEVCVVSVNDVADDYVYDLRLLDGDNTDNNYSILIESMPIYRYDDREYCFACLNSRCNLIYHPHSDAYENSPDMKWHSINSNKMDVIFGFIHEIKYFIEIRSRRSNDLIEHELEDFDIDACEEFERSDFERSSDVIREQLKCPICTGYMLWNIYHCEVGHVICELCKEKLTDCPTCRGPLGNMRNLPLEHLVDEAVLACQNYMRGCGFIDKLNRLSQHERQCIFVDDDPVFECSRHFSAPSSSQ